MEYLGFPLSPNAVRCGTGFSDRCPAHDDRHNSLSLGMGREGQLLLNCHAGCSYQDVLQASGLTPNSHSSSRANPSAQRSQEIRDHAKAESKLAYAREIWDSCRPLDGTLGEAYFASRGIRQGFDALRFHDALRFTTDGQDYPCIVGKVERGPEMVGVHRTFLTADGAKKDRRMIGACAGGAVRLSYGSDGIAVAEGIETGLSAMALYHPKGFSVWAALSASGVKALQLPPYPSALIIYADGDENGVTASISLGERAAKLGWEAATMISPPSRDLNDDLMEREGLK